MAKDQQLQKMIGKNLAYARKMAGYTQLQVMQIIWGVSDNKNRISEIETGLVMPRTEIVHALCDLYKVCPGYIFGFSVEPTLDETAGRVNMLYSGLHEMFAGYVREMSIQMCKLGAEHIAAMPKPHAIALLEASKAVYSAFCASNPSDLAQRCPQLTTAMSEMATVVRVFEQKLAIQMCNLESQLHNIAVEHDPEDGHLTASDITDERMLKPPVQGSRKRAIRPFLHQMSLLMPDLPKDNSSTDAQEQLSLAPVFAHTKCKV